MRKFKAFLIIGVILMAWLSGWGFRKEVPLPTPDSNLVDVPCRISLVADADFHEARADGFDIRITTDDEETLCKYQREYWSGGGGSAATAEIWVKAPSVLSAGGNKLYIYYGKSDAPDGEDAANVWNANFKAVYHLNESSGGPYLDATANSHDSSAGTMPDQGTGRISYGQNFARVSSEYIDIPHSTDFRFDGDATISLWVNVASYLANDIYLIFSKQGPDGADREWSIQANFNFEGTAFGFKVDLWTDGGAWLSAGEADNARSISTWYHIGVRFDQAADELYLYVNGVQVALDNTVSGVQNITGTFVQQIGSWQGGAKYFDGDIDEIRFSDTDRGVPWLKFEYDNINTPPTLGVEEEEEAGITRAVICEYISKLMRTAEYTSKITTQVDRLSGLKRQADFKSKITKQKDYKSKLYEEN